MATPTHGCPSARRSPIGSGPVPTQTGPPGPSRSRPVPPAGPPRAAESRRWGRRGPTPGARSPGQSFCRRPRRRRRVRPGSLPRPRAHLAGPRPLPPAAAARGERPTCLPAPVPAPAALPTPAGRCARPRAPTTPAPGLEWQKRQKGPATRLTPRRPPEAGSRAPVSGPGRGQPGGLSSPPGVPSSPDNLSPPTALTWLAPATGVAGRGVSRAGRQPVRRGPHPPAPAPRQRAPQARRAPERRGAGRGEGARGRAGRPRGRGCGENGHGEGGGGGGRDESTGSAASAERKPPRPCPTWRAAAAAPPASPFPRL